MVDHEINLTDSPEMLFKMLSEYEKVHETLLIQIREIAKLLYEKGELKDNED